MEGYCNWSLQKSYENRANKPIMAILFVYGRILRFLLFTHQSPPFSSRFNSHKITRIGRHKRSLARIRIVRSRKIAPNKYQNKAVPDR